MKTEWSTVAIPVAKGIDVNTRARLVEPGHLLEAENVRFHDGGAKKRRGHTSRKVRGTDAIPAGVAQPDMVAPASWEPFSTDDRDLPSSWVFGWGYNYANRTGHGSRNETSGHPDAHLLFGTAQRDHETLLWDGFRLFSRTPGLPAGAPLVPAGPAVMPHLRAATTAKCSQTQDHPDLADNGTLRVVAWINPVTARATYSVIDSATGATIVHPTELSLANATFAVRCIPVGEWVHILCSDTAGTLQCFSVSSDTPTALENRSLGTCDRYFDCVKVTESKWVVARNTGSLTVLVSVHEADGNNASVVTPAWDASLTDIVGLSLVGSLAIAVHPVTEQLALVVRVEAGDNWIYWRAFDLDGVALTASTQVAESLSMSTPVAVAPKYITEAGGGDAVFDVYWESLQSAAFIEAGRVSIATPTTSLLARRFNLQLASQAFRVGDRTYVWAGMNTTYQSAWYLLDEELLPVGHLEYGTGNVPSSSRSVPLSVNWSGDAPLKDTLVHHCGLGYKVRVASERESDTSNLPAVYAEPSIRFVQMDFLPPFRSAQAGRCAYFAGAQLWCYDGERLTEAGFHHAPEVSIAGTTGGTMTGQLYRYRVDLCYVNAQGEETRSHSFYTDETDFIDSTAVEITIKTALTRREEDAYFLIFRNENGGTQWFLVNSRDPGNANYLANDVTQNVVTFIDTGAVSDAALIQLESHPGNGGFTFIEPIAAPACEVVAAGSDRLWVAGGELPAGQVAPSRLFTPQETPAFNPLVNVQVDRLSEPVTAIGFVGDVTAIFRRTSTYLLDGNGPDNSSQGFWPPARLALTGLGAVSQESLALVPGALLFQSPVGIRALTGGGGVQAVGAPTDAVAQSLDVSGCVVSASDSEARWYSRGGTTLVFNYLYGTWSTWTVPAAGVTRNPTTGLAIVAHPEGVLWEETDGYYRDGQGTFRQRIQFAWLRANSLVDFQRVRRVAGIGEADGAHDVRLAVLYDERPFEEEIFTWSFPEDAADPSWNTDTFGSDTFGSGVLGDAGNTAPLKDAVWRWRRRLRRQKCSVVSFRIDDNYTDGPGFSLTALALEIGAKPGLDRIPWRGGSVSNSAGQATLKNGRE